MRIGLCSVALAAAAGTAAAATPVPSFGDNPGALAMYEHVPAGLARGRPLVVVLHGCTQTASAMEVAGWNKLADEHGFAVIYPEQQTANNPVRCFNWAGEYGDPANLVRGQGENRSIVSMIDAAIATHGSDPARVYLVGFSAGGAFVSVMLATWPERFAAAAIMAGIPYRCATTVNGAYGCQNPGTPKTPAEWGDLVRGAHAYTGPRARVQIWHGSADTIVNTMNGLELVEQWTDVHGADPVADATETSGKATRTQYRKGSEVVVEHYRIDGMGHAVVTGDEAGAACPSGAGAYFSAQGVCSTLRAAAFFGLLGPGGGPGGPGDPGGGGSGSGGGGSGSCDDDGEDPGDELPGCAADAAGGGTSLGAIVLVLALALARRRRRP